MTRFFVKIEQIEPNVFRIEFFYNTDMRYDRVTREIPIIEILNWIANN